MRLLTCIGLLLAVLISPCLARNSHRVRSAGGGDVMPHCPPCDMRTCVRVAPDDCDGYVMKDTCDCCPVCVKSDDEPADRETLTVTTYRNGSDVCDGFECDRHQMCIQNIQGLPICRCPTAYYCKTRPRRKVCSSDGETFMSVCLLKKKACNENRKITVARKGACDDVGSSRREERKRQREERLRQREEKAKQRQQKLQVRQREKERKQETRRQHRQQERAERLDPDRPHDHSQPEARDRSKAKERRRQERRQRNGRGQSLSDEERKSKRRQGINND